MGSYKTMVNLNVTYSTVCQNPKPVCTVKFMTKGVYRSSVNYQFNDDFT